MSGFGIPRRQGFVYYDWRSVYFLIFKKNVLPVKALETHELAKTLKSQQNQRSNMYPRTI